MNFKILTGIIVIFTSGCAIGPYSPIKSANLNADNVFYIEQADRIPKDVMLEAWKHLPLSPQTAVVNGAKIVIPPEIIASVIAELCKTAPELTKGYQAERMNESLLSRRILIKGYTTNEIKEIGDSIKNMGWNIEHMTPQIIEE